MIPLLLATAGRAVAGAAGRAVAAKGVVSALKNRGYISEAGKSASQMARAGSAPRANTQAFRNPYTFAKKTAPDTESSTMGTSAEEPNQTQSNTKKQTLIISADNVFLRTSQAIMESTMPQAPQNIERASGSDELTSNAPRDPSKVGGLGAAAGIILGKLLYKVFDVIVQKIKEAFKTIQKFFLESLSGVYRALDAITPGDYFKSKADAIDEKISKMSAPEKTTPQPETAAPTSTTTPSVSKTPTDTTFFGPSTTSNNSNVKQITPAIVSNNNTVQSLFKTMDTSENTNSNIVNLIKKEEGFQHKAYFDPPKNRQDAQNKELEKRGMTPKPYTFSIGFGHQITKEEVAKGYIDLGDEKIPVKGEGGKDTVLGSTKKDAQPKALKLLQIDLPKYMSRAKEPLGEEAWSRLTEKQQAALISYSYNVGSTKGLVEKQGLKEAIMRGDTTTAGNIIAEKGIKTSSGKIDPTLVQRRKREGELFKQDSIKAVPSGSLNIKPISSSGLLSAPTQTTGRNIEMTSQILNAAPVASTAQNSQPVVINNINAPTVASGKGSSGPAIEMAVFRNIDNSIMANTNRHLRAGILGV